MAAARLPAIFAYSQVTSIFSICNLRTLRARASRDRRDVVGCPKVWWKRRVNRQVDRRTVTKEARQNRESVHVNHKCSPVRAYSRDELGRGIWTPVHANVLGGARYSPYSTVSGLRYVMSLVCCRGSGKPVVINQWLWKLEGGYSSYPRNPFVVFKFLIDTFYCQFVGRSFLDCWHVGRLNFCGIEAYARKTLLLHIYYFIE
jgi:hypothetical protein